MKPASKKIAWHPTVKVARGACLGVALVATALMMGCTLEAGPSDESSDGSAEQSSENSDALRSDGAHCQASCKSTYPGNGWTYRYCNYSIASGCHDWAVSACHKHGLSFVDAAWTHWGSC